MQDKKIGVVKKIDNLSKNDKPLLEVKGLRTQFSTEEGILTAVDGVDLFVGRREILGIVGESGCGKTVLARSILRIVPWPGSIVEGKILFEGKDLLKETREKMREIRGKEITMVFQEPMVSLNPVYRVGNQIEEVLTAHQAGLNQKERRQRIIDLLRQVGIASPEQRISSYPHELSGGMRQRVMIAMALACGNPKLVLADEPTTALDVTIQAQILDLFKRLQHEIGMSVVLITHDLGVVAETANRVAVMYAGSIVEMGSVHVIFQNARHPYTRGLLRSLPQQGVCKPKERLYTIQGIVPNPVHLHPGCKFFDRCDYAREDICSTTEPVLEQIEPEHWVRCRLFTEIDTDENRGQTSK